LSLSTRGQEEKDRYEVDIKIKEMRRTGKVRRIIL
jgi:hypothetical protein